MKEYSTLKERVSKIAKEKNIPLYKLEEEANISRGSISKWDDISPSFEKVCAVAKVLKVNINKFTE